MKKTNKINPDHMMFIILWLNLRLKVNLKPPEYIDVSSIIS